jgi:hypothetical protein
MDIIIVCSFIFAIASILFIDHVYLKDVRKYRFLVPKPEHLLYESADFAFFEYPNQGKSHVEVFGRRLHEVNICNAVMKDMRKLEKMGYTFDMDYRYDSSVPHSKEEFDILLVEYQEKISEWKKENQGRPYEKTKPRAPYDFVKITVTLPEASKFHHSFEW